MECNSAHFQEILNEKDFVKQQQKPIRKVVKKEKFWGKEKCTRSISDIDHSTLRLYQILRFPPRQSGVIGQRFLRFAQLCGPVRHNVTQCPHSYTNCAQFVVSRHMKHSASDGVGFVTLTQRLNLLKFCLKT